ncbi:metallophosphoesterase [Brucepastera parasyntrophica]|uniref:metallophosphoesterase n=1 Tax=Brucepastera parasyntrophica TaxID=2880008 RepID=UPI00210AF20E|nr:metallophosphoesterase [Brucepastera parasyntrophica]ULQ60932.1 metallophosphoesterase [Brucepastera parasyntrophica]
MKILILSDGHGNLSALDRLKPAAKNADMVLYAGDFAECFKPETGLPFLERLASLHDDIFAVLGNCDEPDFIGKLDEYDMRLESTLSSFNGLVLTGSGGGAKFTGKTPNERTDEELAGDLRLVSENSGEDNQWHNLVIVTHNPPKDTSLDRISTGTHVGSPLIREFIETYQPLLAVSGHIHESAATDTIGRTVLVNPGPLDEGRYAIAEAVCNADNRFTIMSVELKEF